MSKPDDNVVLFPGDTRLPIPVERVLQAFTDMDGLTEVVVVGIAHGELHYWFSQATEAEAHFLLEKAQKDMLNE